MEDFQLLRNYVEHQSERAFSELVVRHLDLVYSTAMRLVNEWSLAEDITQLVFIRLARKAGSLGRGVVLTGWLYRTTQYVARTALRSDGRRKKRESVAMQFSAEEPERDSIWQEVAPLLEEAMTALRPPEQDVVLLRFFAGKSMRELGDALGISDDTAQKRVNRAVERLRNYFARRGVVVPAALLGSTLSVHAVHAAPAPLAAATATAVASGMVAGADSGLVATVKFLLAKLQAHGAGAGFAAVLLLGGVAALRPLPAGQAAATNDAANPVFLVKGRVQTQDGQPVAGALIRVATPGATVRLYDRVDPAATNPPIGRAWTQSAKDGTFAVGLVTVPPGGQAVVAVTDEAGYGLMTADELSANPDVVLQPWCRIEGVLRIGRAVGREQTVNIGLWGASETYEWNLVSHGQSVRTDERGRFVFPRVAPGDVWLTRTVAVRPGDGRQSGHHYVRLQPGERREVTLGGTGGTVLGRLETEPGSRLKYYGSLWARESHGMRRPRHWRELSAEDKRRAVREWRESPESEPFKLEVRTYEFPVQPDGTFRVVDVRPGRYRMQVRADAPVAPGESPRLAAMVELQIEVPDGADANEPLDVGTLWPGEVPSR